MPIKPLDLQVMIPKSSQVGRHSEQEAQKHNHEQYNLNIKDEKQTDKSMRQVIKKEENTGIGDKKNGRNNQYNGNKKKNKKQSKTNKKKVGYKNGHFDISI